MNGMKHTLDMIDQALDIIIEENDNDGEEKEDKNEYCRKAQQEN